MAELRKLRAPSYIKPKVIVEGILNYDLRSESMTVQAKSGEVRVGGHPDVILGICCMSLLLVGMDVTIVNVALPAIQQDLHASVAGLQWIMDAYTLVVASLLMLAGSVSDRVGRRLVFQSGLACLRLPPFSAAWRTASSN